MPPVVGRPEGKVLPPAAMYGVPAPVSQFADSSVAEQARDVVRTILEQDFVHQTPAEHLWHSSLTYYGPAGFGLASGFAEYRAHILEPIYIGFGNTSLDLRILVCEDHFCGAHGRLHGVHRGDFLGFPSSGREVSLRFGMHWRILDGRAMEGWAILDMPDFFNQFGMDMFEVAALQNPGPVLHDAASQR